MAALKVLQLTDLHIAPRAGELMLGIDTEAYFRQTLKHAVDQHGPFDLALLTGDLAQDPCVDSYQRISRHLSAFDMRCLCLPGNHDDFDLMRIYLNSGKLGCDKRLVLGNWLIVMLNSQIIGSPVGMLAEAELEFLEGTLRAHKRLPTLLAVHHHCVESGSPWMDAMRIRNSAAFLALIKQHPQVKAVTCGHVHQAFAKREAHIELFATPSSCFQFTPQSDDFSLDDTPPGYRVFRLGEDGCLQSEVFRLPIRMDDLDRNAHEY
ncbi:3',5'-cyclic-AMP phosphodiesterase [Methylomonas sp. SURF-2]|uniref:3',5'-cyclic-AMP phosphodiesterase n=1 Tax=Methylomonas subterranea TaxID=2952225 RepID=A0ABT1TED9_9GAMM|nr:3',5'-cyclic-AMP phosphodiesterase [Methylomonas sp. SURF-2]MCQ8103638.1 3',5'-cyclic-AMP phosphodiesterase [Methylomonas sp. SURF-2]